MDPEKKLLLIKKLSETNPVLYERELNKIISAFSPEEIISTPNRIEFRVNGVLHREDGPAVVYVYDDIKLTEEMISGNIGLQDFEEYKDTGLRRLWYKNGIKHREDGPADCMFFFMDDHYLYSEQWFQNGLLHRLNEPASVSYYQNGQIMAELWSVNGDLHREDGPALIHYYPNGVFKKKEWFMYGQPDNEDGPISIEYYKNGNMYQVVQDPEDSEEILDGGPNRIIYRPNGQIYKTFCLVDDVLYNTQGPAYVKYNENGLIEEEVFNSDISSQTPYTIITNGIRVRRRVAFEDYEDWLDVSEIRDNTDQLPSYF